MNKNEELEILMGLEIHITAKSERKIFNWNRVYKGDRKPNSEIGPWELGYLGTLPIINPEVIKIGLKMAIALEMEIERYLVFDRKIYNYFDLPKGFQITQRKPFAKNGSFFLIEKNGNLKEIKIKSLQLEEDTGKSIYSSNSDVKLDFNRSGNPLIELVTDPIFGNIDEVCEFIKQLQFFLTYLGISDAKMEKGQLRVDLNFSIKSNDKKYSTPRYEIKNLNSINNVKNSIKYELGKHKEIISKGKEIPESHTLSFNEGKKSTIPSREKKEYFYVPEVNIPPIKISEDDIYLLKNTIPTPHWKSWVKIKKSNTINRSMFMKDDEFLKIFEISLFKEEKLENKDFERMQVFYLNYMSPLSFNLDDFIKKAKSCIDIFFFWKDKKINKSDIIKELRKLKTEDSYTFSKAVFDNSNREKSVFSNEEVKSFLNELWNDNLKSILSKDKFKVRNYLFGQIKMNRSFSSINLKEVQSLVDKFIEKKTLDNFK